MKAPFSPCSARKTASTVWCSSHLLSIQCPVMQDIGHLMTGEKSAVRSDADGVDVSQLRPAGCPSARRSAAAAGRRRAVRLGISHCSSLFMNWRSTAHSVTARKETFISTTSCSSSPVHCRFCAAVGGGSEEEEEELLGETRK